MGDDFSRSKRLRILFSEVGLNRFGTWKNESVRCGRELLTGGGERRSVRTLGVIEGRKESVATVWSGERLKDSCRDYLFIHVLYRHN